LFTKIAAWPNLQRSLGTVVYLTQGWSLVKIGHRKAGTPEENNTVKIKTTTLQ